MIMDSANNVFQATIKKIISAIPVKQVVLLVLIQPTVLLVLADIIGVYLMEVYALPVPLVVQFATHQMSAMVV